MKILVTGGCGYIGSHTIVDLINEGFEVICLDNLSRGNSEILNGVQQITGKEIVNHNIDLCNETETRLFFQNHLPDAVIHFAAYKSVGESMQMPLLYYRNNINSLTNLLQCIADFNVKHFVFSSSCSVYGNSLQQPVVESMAFNKAESPYAHTKQMCEQIIHSSGISKNVNVSVLRYFNPVGAHPSALIGEFPFGKPENLVPAITQFAAGILPQLNVHGMDYKTKDGTCIRDYVHVMDIAQAHTLALKKSIASEKNIFPLTVNLGSGNGNTVLEMIHAFENANELKLKYVVGPRRAGDVAEIFADTSLAKQIFNWSPQYTITDMMKSAWQWQLHLLNKS